MPEPEKTEDNADNRIIVNSETRAEDPRAEQSDSDEKPEIILPEAPRKSLLATKIPIDQLSPDQKDDLKVVEPDTTPEEAKSEQPTNEDEPLEEPSSTEGVDNKTNDASQESNDEPGKDSIVNELAEAAASKKQEKADNDQEQVYIKSLEKLVDEKTYNVPIGQLTHKRNNRILAIATLLIIIVLTIVIKTIMS